MDEKDAPNAAGSQNPTDQGSDSDFSSESASVAFDLAPDDTTVGAEAAADDAGTARAEGEESGTAAAATAATDVKAKGEAPKGKAPQPSARIKDLKKEIDTLTHSKHKTAAELATDQGKLATLRAEIADLERRKAGAPAAAGAGAAAADGKPKDADKGPGPRPEHPKYRDFDTDDAYEEACAKWRTDDAAWDARRIDLLKNDITQGVEARFKSKDGEQAAIAAEGRIVSTLDKVRSSKTDWNEKADALKGVQSAWYNPELHKGALTPFLSDLSMSLMLQGREEGAELLHWLGSDPARAQRLADLLPTRPLRDALVNAPSVTPLLEHFATPDGEVEFEALKRMHPIPMMQAIGALSMRLAPVPRGSGAAAHSITQAQPSARPPAGSPGARGGGGGTADPSKVTFDDWMAAEDEREKKDKLRLAGVASA